MVLYINYFYQVIKIETYIEFKYEINKKYREKDYIMIKYKVVFIRASLCDPFLFITNKKRLIYLLCRL